MSDRCALLLTDIVDSTRLTERLGDAEAARLWAAHDRLARDLLPTFRGREIDKTDGLLLLFAQAADAAGYVAAYHRSLQTLEPVLKARAGLHVGDVILRENPAADVALGAKPIEVEGIAKATAARIMSVASAGQTLMSSEARQALAGEAWRMQSHGHWRLRGFSQPVELFEIGDADTPFAPPADNRKAYRVVRQGELWLPLRRIGHSLPAERDAFVGRREPLDELARQFDAGARLVCVTGIGGAGKTRLAARFAWAWLGEFPGGAWFCDLSQARGVDGIARAVSQALDVPLGEEDPIVQLGNAIAARGPCLIALDNFEQVSRHAEATLGHWMDRAREARFLVTSRGVLGIAGESVLPLPPLPPADATELFMRRAQAARPDFHPGDEDHAAIAPLVKLLDGLPLAIELAAARVRLMPPHTLLSRMSERFKLLSTSSGRQQRQATLRAAFDWSWELLSLPEKAALSQLSVFEGGFTLQAAEAVLDLSLVDDPPWPPDALQSLVEQSFVRQVQDERFDLLVSVQEYAAEHLRSTGRYAGSGPAAALAAQARHGDYFAGLDEHQATAQRCVELDNLVAACRRAAARRDAAAATHTLQGAWAGLQLRGPFKVGAELAALVASMPGLAPALKTRVDWIAGRALQALGHVAQARQRYDAALAEARSIGDRQHEGQLQSSLGSLDANEGHAEDARRHLAAALLIARESADRALECEVLNGLGTLNNYQGRIDDARADYEAALSLAREIGDRRWEGGVLGNLGNLDAGQGRLAQARVHYQAGLVVARELGNRQWEGNALCNLGLLHHVMGERAEAREKLQAALQAARELGHARLQAIVLCNLGIVDDAMGHPDDARAHYEAALVVARELGDRRSEGQFLGYLGTLNARQHRFDEARGQLDAGAGLLREASDLSSLGVLLCGRAEMEWLSGERERAARSLAEAEAIADDTGAGSGSELAVALERVRSLRSSDEAA
jgi:predicted ATPase/class 3 adenylate cyclase